MKARIFPKLNIPDDLQELGSFLRYYDTVQEQIDFLKYVQLEIDLYCEQILDVDFDAMELTRFEDWRKVLDKKIEFYENLLEDEERKKAKEYNIAFVLYNFDFNKIKEFSENLEPVEAIMYLKYVLKEFDREKRENFFLFISEEDKNHFSKQIIIDDPSKLNDPPDLRMLGIGSKQKLNIENFEKNILNEIDYLKNIKSSVINSFPKSRGADLIDEYYQRGKVFFINHKDHRLGVLQFYDEMKKYFGEDITICHQVFYRIVNDVPVIRIFGFDIEDVKSRMDRCIESDNLDLLIESEKNKTEELLESINEYKPRYYYKWEKRYNANLDEDWLEEKGYTDDKDTSFDLHYKGWLKYYLEEIQSEVLLSILKWGFSGRMGDFDNIEDKQSVKIFLDGIENELKTFKEEIIQSYVLKSAKLINKVPEKLHKKHRPNVSPEIIAEEVIKLWDNGLEVFEEIYQELSLQSEKLFGVQLNNNQIKGRYQRFIKTHSDYKRNKY